MKKRVFSLVLVIAMLLSMASGMTLRELAEDQPGIARQTEPSAEPSVAPETPAESEAPTETEIPAESEEPTETETSAEPEEDTDAPAADAPADESASDQEQTPSEDMDRPDAVEPGSPSTGGESDAVTEASAAEEPAAEDVNLLTADGENEIMPIAADIDISRWSGSLSYYEKSGPFLPSGTKDALIVRLNTGVYNQRELVSFIEGLTVTLNGPSEKNIELGTPEKTSFNTGYISVYWPNMRSEIESAGAGSYTLKIEDKSGGEAKTKEFPCKIVKVTFDLDGKGTFADNKGTTYDGYGLDGNSFSFFDVPEITPTGEGEFIGWAAQTGVTEYSGLIKNASEATGRVYAAYGEAKKYEFTFYSDAGCEQAITELDLGTVLPDSTASTEIWVKNTGNQPIGALRVQGTPNYFTVTFEKNNIAVGESVKLTIAPKPNLSSNTYNENISFWDMNGFMASGQLTVTVKVEVPTVKVSLDKDVTKEYGETRTSADILSHVTVGSGDPKVDELGLVFRSDGFAANAKVGSYPIILQSAATGVHVVLEGSPQVVVAQATPQGTVNAGGVVTGQDLANSVLTGLFHNPHQSDMEVNGTLSWDTEQTEATENLKPGDHTFNWTFKPSSDNYTSVSGKATVTVSEKTPTEITATSGNTFAYNGVAKSMTFTTNRPSSEPRVITVEYKLQTQGDGDWTTTPPKNAGVYDVKASIEESEHYAGGSQTFTMTITPRTPNFYAVAKDKVYDGTNKAEVDIHLSYTVGTDDVAVGTSEATFDTKDVGTRKNVAYRALTFTGRDAGNYQAGDGVHHTTGNITPATITSVSPSNRITKEYGETIALSADQFNFEGLVNGENSGVLDVEFFCNGMGAAAVTGSYSITAELHGGNYVLANKNMGNAGNLYVEAATPELLEGTLNASYGRSGNTLDTVTVSGTFVNPHDHNMVVPGTFSWVDSSATMTGTGTYTAKWQFTPEDTDNYNIPEPMEVEITLLDKDPIQFTVQDKTVTYNGEPHSLSVEVGDIAITDSGVDAAKLVFLVEYRHHLELMNEDEGIAPAALEATGDAWTTEAPTDAGIYDVQVTVKAGEYAAPPYNRADNTFTATLTINKADPDVTDVETEIEVAEGTVLNGTELSNPKDINGEELGGTFVWENTSPVTTDGEVYKWVFAPNNANYNAATGRTTVKLAADERTITATVYNLPNALSYRDYAVVDVAESGLKAGDTVTFYTDETCANAESDPTTYDGTGDSLVVYLDDDALADNDSVIYARITSSQKHEADEITYGPEIGLTVKETVVTAVIGGDPLTLTAEASGGDPASITYTVSGDSDGSAVELKHEENALTATVTGLKPGHVHIIVNAVFAHPDKGNHPDTTIEFHTTVHVTVQGKVGSLTVSKTVTGDLGDKTQPFTFTVTLTPGNETAAPADEPATDVFTGTGDYGDMHFANYVATFALKHGESVTAQELPAGTAYTVTESGNEGYTVTKTGDTGTITAGESVTAAFTNTKEPGEVLPGVIGEGVPTVKIPDLDRLKKAVELTEEEKKQLADGVDITVELVVSGADTVPEKDKTAAADILEKNGLVAGVYLDISLLKTVGEGEPEPINQTTERITLVLTVPEDLQTEGRVYQIVRIHEGGVELLPDLDNDPKTITFETDQFSTYGIVYKDETTAAPGPTETPEATAVPTAEPTAVPTAAPTATAAPSTAADKSAPDTGDSNDPGLWLGLLALSMAGLGAIGAVRRRGKRSR